MGLFDGRFSFFTAFFAIFIVLLLRATELGSDSVLVVLVDFHLELRERLVVR